MNNSQAYFKDKKVTVMGLGLLGRGVGDAAYIAEAGATEVIVTDLKTESELQESVDQLKQYDNVKFVLGEHREEDFVGRDFILVAAGVPTDSPYLEAARAAGVPLRQSAALFTELSGIPMVGVTGTRGKSTVTHMIHHVLEQATGEKVILGGNIRGVSNLQLLNDVQEGTLAVMELDSWQLQGFAWAEISPQVAVFTNFMNDHMNYYHGDMDAYFKDKANIFIYQEADCIFVTTPEVFKQAQGLQGQFEQEVILTDASSLPEESLISMPGAHNQLNAAIAFETLRALSLEDELIFEGLASFPGVPGRLEYLGEVGGVRVYNDNNATTPEATAAGVAAFEDPSKVILIAGGNYKELNPEPLVKAAQQCKKVILIPGSGTDLIVGGLDGEVVETLAEAVAAGLAGGEPGDTLLFSPGFSSFSQWQNEYQRGDEFVELIKQKQNG